MLSDRDWEMTGGGDDEVPGGAIPTELNRYIQACAENLVRAAWHPYRARLLQRSRLWKLDREKWGMTEELSDHRPPRMDWDSVWIPQ